MEVSEVFAVIFSIIAGVMIVIAFRKSSRFWKSYSSMDKQALKSLYYECLKYQIVATISGVIAIIIDSSYALPISLVFSLIFIFIIHWIIYRRQIKNLEKAEAEKAQEQETVSDDSSSDIIINETAESGDGAESTGRMQ
jgi:flagellar biosynthesis component FlhA